MEKMGIKFLTRLFNRLLMGERMPEEWRRSVLISFIKTKGTHSAVETTEYYEERSRVCRKKDDGNGVTGKEEKREIKEKIFRCSKRYGGS